MNPISHRRQNKIRVIGGKRRLVRAFLVRQP
jgi:hypothetical protein